MTARPRLLDLFRRRRKRSASVTYNINVHTPPRADPTAAGRQAVEALRKYQKHHGAAS